MSRWKLILAIAGAALFIVILIQNTSPVDTRILVWSVPLPRAILLFVTFAIGFIVGALWVARRGRAKSKEAARSEGA